jgi:hypothetical protein
MKVARRVFLCFFYKLGNLAEYIGGQILFLFAKAEALGLEALAITQPEFALDQVLCCKGLNPIKLRDQS